MEIPDIGGLPAHPLIVHLPVVLVPLATIGALIMLIRPGWRRVYEIPTAALAGLAAVATQLALMSGEQLQADVRRSELIEQHAHIAEQARPFIFIFAALLVAVSAWDIVQRRLASADIPARDHEDDHDHDSPPTGSVVTARRTSTPTTTARATANRVAVVLTALGLVFGVISTVQVYRAGHSGATATWHDTNR